MELSNTEKLEDLQAGGLKIIQDKRQYRFTSDAVLLANTARVPKGGLLVDLGCGSGIISILMAYKQKPSKVLAVEIQPQLADMAKRSVQFNGMESVIEVFNTPLQQFAAEYGGKKADAVVCNPPYVKVGAGEAQEQEHLKICRHEVAVTLDEICRAASLLLKSGGKFFVVHKAERCAELFELMQKHKIAPKEITVVCSREGDAPNLVIVCGAKDGNAGLKWHKPIIMFDDAGNYTKTIARLYGENDG